MGGESLARGVARLFRDYERGLILGGFTALRTSEVEEAMGAGRLLLQVGEAGPDEVGPMAAVIGGQMKAGRRLRDFAGNVVGEARGGEAFVERFACAPGADAALLELLRAVINRRVAWLLAWQEHKGARAALEGLGAQWRGTQVLSSSELRGIYSIGPVASWPVPRADFPSLMRLGSALSPERIGAVVDTLGRSLPAFANHYSHYNVRHSWSALSLRGYGPEGAPSDPRCIEKPAEMPKAWKAEHPGAAAWRLSDSPLRERLSVLEPLIAAVPGPKHRIRLMRLAPGGGELLRHADITDPDAGTAEGKTLRIHLPLQTNPACVFRSWNLHGGQTEATMQSGEVWYLDTRKPHTARNDGDTPRLHLVMDVESCPELLALLGVSAPLPAVSTLL